MSVLYLVYPFPKYIINGAITISFINTNRYVRIRCFYQFCCYQGHGLFDIRYFYRFSCLEYIKLKQKKYEAVHRI